MSVEFGKVQPEMNGIRIPLSVGLEPQNNQGTIGNTVFGNEVPQLPPYELYRSTPKSELPPDVHFGAWRPFKPGEKVYPQHTELIKGRLFVPVRLYGPGK